MAPPTHFENTKAYTRQILDRMKADREERVRQRNEWFYKKPCAGCGCTVHGGTKQHKVHPSSKLAEVFEPGSYICGQCYLDNMRGMRSEKAKARSEQRKLQKRLRMQLYEVLANQFDLPCYLCGEPLPADASLVDRDHVSPTSKGGVTVLDNLRVVHRECNRAKGNGDAVDDIPREAAYIALLKPDCEWDAVPESWRA